MTDQNLGLRVGASCNQAAIILQGSWRALADGTLTVEQLTELYGDLAANFFETAATLQSSHGLAQAFPGTTQASPQEAQAFQPQQQAPAQGGFTPANQPASNVVQAPFGQQQAPQQGQNFQPVQAPGSSHKDDAKWQELFANPSGFYDNRQDKRSPNGPDFKAKQGDTALWLNGKFGAAPQWVFDRLQGGFGPVQ